VSGVSKAVIARFRPGLRHEAASTLALWWRFYYDGHADFPALTLYGVAAHHGIVRTSLSAREQEEPNICGIPLSVSQIPWAWCVCSARRADRRLSDLATVYFRSPAAAARCTLDSSPFTPNRCRISPVGITNPTKHI
jgi:hypothetical protein